MIFLRINKTFFLFNKNRIKLISLVFICIFLLTGCQEPVLLEPTTTFEIASNPTISPTNTASPTSQIGLVESPIIIGFLVRENPALYENNAEAMLISLEEKTGYEISFEAFDDPQEGFDQLRTGNIHFLFIQPLTYLAASERDLVVPLLVSNHFGLFKYGTQFFANADSGFITYFDETSNNSIAPAEMALSQFEGKQPCWTEPSSISGTIAPYGLLAQNGVSFLPPAYLQNPGSLIRALYIKGICDFGATYSHSGDPRTSSQVINDLSDVMDRIKIIWRSDPIIPNLGLSASATISAQMQSDIKNAFLNMISDEQGKAIISDALQYDIQGFLAIEDDYYDDLRKLVKAANINPYQHLGY